MAGGFGGGSWGTTPWGGSVVGETYNTPLEESVSISESLTVEVPLNFVRATSVSAFAVRLDFSSALSPSHAPNFAAESYIIPGLTVLSVSAIPQQVSSVLLLTTEQARILYEVTASLNIQSVQGELLNPSSRVKVFQGDAVPPTFGAVAQSPRKIRLNFQNPMLINAALEDEANYQVISDKGVTLPITVVQAVGPTGYYAEILLGTDLESTFSYTVFVSSAVTTQDLQSLSPNQSTFTWVKHIPNPIRTKMSDFSGQDTVLGTPKNRVFFSPAFENPVSGNTLEVDSVRVCTRAYDKYNMPGTGGPSQVLYTNPGTGSSQTTSVLGLGVTWASAETLGLAQFTVRDLRQDTLGDASDSRAEATLRQTFPVGTPILNSTDWVTNPASGGAGVFRTVDNSVPVGSGPTTVISLQ